MLLSVQNIRVYNTAGLSVKLGTQKISYEGIASIEDPSWSKKIRSIQGVLKVILIVLVGLSKTDPRLKCYKIV